MGKKQHHTMGMSRRVKRVYDVDPNLLPAQVKTLYESHFGGGGFSPLSIPSLELFLDSTLGITLNGVDVSNWADQSGKGNDAAQGTASKQPFVQPEGQGSNQVLEFDGSEFLEIPYAAGLNTQEYSVFVVGREFRQANSGYYTTNPSGSINGGGFGMATNPTRFFRHYVSNAVTNVILEVSGTKVINQWNDFYQLRRADNTAQSYSNSMGLASGSKATTLVYPGTDPIRIGRIYGGTGSLELIGQIRAIIVFSRELNAGEITQMNDWIASDLLNQAYEHVVWTGLTAGLTAYGNTLENTSGVTADYDEAAQGTKTLTGDGAVEVTVSGITSTTSRNFIALTNDNPDDDFHHLDFALQQNDATLYAWENNSGKANPGTPSIIGDRYKIDVTDDVVTYSRNGIIFYTSLVTPTYPLTLDTVFFGSRVGAQLKDVRLYGSNWS